MNKGSKIIKKIYHIVAVTLLILILLITIIMVLFLVPAFQNLVADRIADHYSRKLNISISIDKVMLKGFLKINLNGVYVSDHKNDTLLYVQELQTDLLADQLFRNHLQMNRLEIDGAVFNLKTYEGDSIPNLTLILRQIASETAEDTTKPKPFFIDCREIAITNTTFRLINENRKRDSLSGMDYNDMDIRVNSIKLRNTNVVGLDISAMIDELEVTEKSGFQVKKMSGDVVFDNSGFVINDLLLETNNSDLDLDLEFQYGDLTNFSYFLDSVKMIAVIRPSELQMNDIGYFAPVLFSMVNTLEFSGLFNGTVTDFIASDFSVKTGIATEFNGRIGMKGLPDFFATDIDLDIEKLVTSKSDIENFKLPGDSSVILLPDELDLLGVIQLNGKFKGKPYDFIANTDVVTAVGDVNADIQLRYDETKEIFKYFGVIKASQLNLGTLTGYSDLGMTDLEIEVDGIGLTVEDMNVYITGWLESLDYKGNIYDRIVVGGNYKENQFSGRLFVTDDLINLLFDGLADFSGDEIILDLALTVDEANLKGMNLIDLSENLILSTHADINIKFKDLNNLEADLIFDSTWYTYSNEKYIIDSLYLHAGLKENDTGRIKVRSDLFDLDMNGNFGLISLIEAWEDVIRYYYHQDLTAPPGGDLTYVNFELVINNADPILAVFIPELLVSQGTKISGSLKKENYVVNLEVSSDSIHYEGFKLKGINLSAEAADGNFSLDMGSDDFILLENTGVEDANNDTIGLENFQISLKSQEEILDWRLSWSDKAANEFNAGSFSGSLDYHQKSKLDLFFAQGAALINGVSWELDKKSNISIDTNAIAFNDVKFMGDNLRLYIDGRYSESPHDTLGVKFENWELSSLNVILSNYSMAIDGLLNGNLKISNSNKNLSLLADLNIDSLMLNGVDMGEADIYSAWEPMEKAINIVVSFSRLGNVAKSRELGITGKIYTGREDRMFDVQILLDNFNLMVFNPFLEGIASQLSGFATGNIALTGNTDKPYLLGSIDITRTEFIIDYLNTRYSISHNVILDTNRIYLKDAELFDTRGEKAILNAVLSHHYFKDMYIDLVILPHNFLGLETNRYQNEMFFGTGIASGKVKINGPFDNIHLDVAVKTEKGTNVILPISYSVNVSQGDFIVFLKDENVDSVILEDYRVTVKGLELDLDLEVTPDAQLEVYLPSNMGFIKAKGSGNIKMGVDPKGYLTLNGKYVLADGVFNFNLEQLISKRFNILPGSYIAWSGDIYEADVNIRALYRTKTTLSGLAVNLTEEAASEKVVVYCIISLTDDLFNPTIKFSLEFPYLSESMKQNVYAALDTSNAALMNEQAISLLVLNSFSYSGSSPSNPINTYSILANQLSSMLSKISNDFDIGVNYIPGDDLSQDEFQVAMSTQLLNDRLVIDGNLDVPTGNNTGYSSNLVGDVYLEYKLTPDGRFRVKAFNRSNNLNTLEQYSPYTQGVGVFYRREFSRLNEIWRKQESLQNSPDVEDPLNQ